jgi:hypothetical protein
MATFTERKRALRKGARPGFRSFTIGVSKEDLRVIAKHGYEGVLSTDHDQRAQALSLFIETYEISPCALRSVVLNVATFPSSE